MWWNPFSNRARQPVEEVDARTVITNELYKIIARKGFAVSGDLAQLPLPRSTTFYNLRALVRDGLFYKRGRRFFATIDDDGTPVRANIPPAPIRHAAPTDTPPLIASTFELQKIYPRPEQTEFPDPREQPVDPAHRAICPPSEDNPPPQRIPDVAVENIFREVKQYYPKFPRVAFDTYIAQGVPPEQILEDVRQAFADSKEGRNNKRATTRIAPAPSHPGDEYAAQIAGKKREVVDPEAFQRIQENELRQLYEGKNRMRSHIRMDMSGASTHERAIVETNRYAEAASKKKKENDGDAQSLLARMKSWFDN
jgi:hypothetical protein